MVTGKRVLYLSLVLFAPVWVGSAVVAGTGDIPNVDLNGVSFPTPKRGWVVGNGGLVLTTSDGGASWSQQASGTAADLLAVDFVDRLHGWAVGSADTLVHTEDGGETWTPTTTGIPLVELRAVDFASRTHGWAVGGSQTVPVAVATTDGGETWLPQVAPAALGLNDVSFADESRGFAVGFLDAAFRTDDGGTTWAPMAVSSDVEDSFDAVLRLDPMTGVAAGFAGRIHRTVDGGVIWEEVADFDHPITDLASSGESVFAVGEGGLFARSEDGGASWVLEVSGTSANLYGVAAPSPTTGVAVGAAQTSGSAALEVLSLGALPGPRPVNVALKPERCEGLTVAWRARVPGEPRAAAAVDLDGDGRIEVVVGGPDGIRALRPFAPMATASVWDLPLQMTVTRIVPAELDGDPGPEIAVGVRGTPSRSGVIALEGESGSVLWRARVVGGVTLLHAADLDGDGLDDLVATGTAHALYGLSGEDGSLLREGRPLEARPTDLDVADLNGDGVLDAVAVTAEAKALAFDGVDGALLWTYQVSDGNVLPVGSITQRRALEAVAVGDLTGDGTPDVVLAGVGVPQAVTRGPSNDVGSRGGGLVAAVDGRDGSLLWDYAEVGAIFRAVGLGDLTGDGTPDVVAHGSAVGRGRLVALDGRGRSVDAVAVPEPLVLWGFDTTRETGPFQNQGVPSPDAVVLHDADADGTSDVFLSLESGWLLAVSGRPPTAAPGESSVQEPAPEALWQRVRSDNTRHNFIDVVESRGRHYALTLDSDHLVSLREASTGRRVWSYDSGGRVALDLGDLEGDGVAEISVGRSSGRVLALDGAGRRITGGDAFLPQSVRGVVAIDVDGIRGAELVGVARDGTVEALDPATGGILWIGALDVGVTDVAGGAGTVIVGTTDGRVMGLDASNGRVRFEESVGQDVGVTVLVFSQKSRVFAVGDDGGGLRFLDASGRTVGSASTGSSSVAAIAPVSVDGREAFAVASGSSFGLYSSSGGRAWSADVPDLAIDVAPADLDGDGSAEVIGRTAFGQEPPAAIALTGQSGDVLWKVPVGNPGGLGGIDVDGDGDEEALVGNSELVGKPGVRAFDLDGSLVGACRTRRSPDVIRVGDVNGDGIREAVVGMLEGDLYLVTG